MNIGEASARRVVSAEMVRHYEPLGLAPKVALSRAGHRVCGLSGLCALRFIRHRRELGFPMSGIARRLALRQHRRCGTAGVERIAKTHVAELEPRIAEMTDMKRTLDSLVRGRQGNDRPDCPVLAGPAAPSPVGEFPAVRGFTISTRAPRKGRAPCR